MSEYYTITDEAEEMRRATKEQPQFRRELNRILYHFCEQASPLLEKKNTLVSNNNTRAFDTQIEQLRVRISQLQEQTEAKIDQAYSSYLERLEKAFDVLGKDVDEKALALLDPSRVQLTQDEFDRLAKPYLGNPAMEAAFRTYAEKTHLAFRGTMGIEEKKQLAGRVYRAAVGFLYSDNGNGLSTWLTTNAGYLFNEANLLTE
nr:hypothetical protein [uncultured Solibaculum sp.]